MVVLVVFVRFPGASFIPLFCCVRLVWVRLMLFRHVMLLFFSFDALGCGLQCSRLALSAAFFNTQAFAFGYYCRPRTTEDYLH